MAWVHYAPIQRQGTNQNPVAGAVLFAGSLGALDSDDSKLHWDNTNKFLGIGTNSPTTALDVRADGALGAQLNVQDSTVAGFAGAFIRTGADVLTLSSATGSQSITGSGSLNLNTGGAFPITMFPNGTPTWIFASTGELDGGGNFMQLTERADPAAPAANKGRLYVKDSGGGKSQLVIRFPTGAVQVIATEP